MTTTTTITVSGEMLPSPLSPLPAPDCTDPDSVVVLESSLTVVVTFKLTDPAMLVGLVVVDVLSPVPFDPHMENGKQLRQKVTLPHNAVLVNCPVFVSHHTVSSKHAAARTHWIDVWVHFLPSS